MNRYACEWNMTDHLKKITVIRIDLKIYAVTYIANRKWYNTRCIAYENLYRVHKMHTLRVENLFFYATLNTLIGN